MTPVEYAHALVRDTMVPTNMPPTMYDRPGWIPDWVGDDWDPSILAYQTEEESLPASPIHNDYLYTIAGILHPHLQRLNMLLLIDVFLGYCDEEGIKQRIAPDLTIAPCEPHDLLWQLNGGYDLDDYPVPPCLIEVISPDSWEKDVDKQYHLYERLGVTEYLVVRVVNKKGYILDQIEILLWRLEHGQYSEVSADDAGFFPMQSIKVRIGTDGENIIKHYLETGERLLTHAEREMLQKQAEKHALEEAEKRQQAEKRADEAFAAGQQAHARATALRLLSILDDMTISQATGLSVDEVRQLREKL